MRFWTSWEEKSPDYRPLTDPPTAPILGWWKSGEAGDGSHATLCAWVEAPSYLAVEAAIDANWPAEGRRVWRFTNDVGSEWRPTDRFPLAPWMLARASR